MVFDSVYNQPQKLLIPFFDFFVLLTQLQEWADGFWAFSNELLTISFTIAKDISEMFFIKSFKTLFKMDIAISSASDMVFCG